MSADMIANSFQAEVTDCLIVLFYLSSLVGLFSFTVMVWGVTHMKHASHSFFIVSYISLLPIRQSLIRAVMRTA